MFKKYPPCICLLKEVEEYCYGPLKGMVVVPMCDSATQSAVGMRHVHPYARKHGHDKVDCLVLVSGYVFSNASRVSA